jgi:hypothetical protein
VSEPYTGDEETARVLLTAMRHLAIALGRCLPRDLDENGKDRRTGAKLGHLERSE